MVLAKLALATALLAWFVWKARGNRLFLLGIPILMVMGESVFFNRMRPFWTPGRFEPQTHIMGWLVVVWLIIMWEGRRSGRLRAGPFGPGRLLPEEVPLLLLAVLILAQALVAGAGSGDLADGVLSAADLGYLLIGYLLVRGIACQFSRAQVISFLGTVVIVNTIAAALYVVHQGLGVSIYTGGEYFTTVFRGVEITRTFHFAPQFTLLALGFVLAQSRWTAGWLVILAITVLSVLVSYTRTLLIAVVVAFLVALVVRELRRPSASRFIRRTLVIVVSALVLLAGFAVFLPAQSRFVTQRLTEFASAGRVSDVGNWQVRERKYGTVNEIVLKTDPLLGMGFPAPGSNPVDSQVYRLSADMTWIPILYHVGYVGLALFALVLAGFGLRALMLTLGGDDARRYLGLVYLIVIVLTTLVGFTAWTFMEPRVAPLGLWFLAFVAAEALGPSSEATEDEVAVDEVADAPARTLRDRLARQRSRLLQSGHRGGEPQRQRRHRAGRHGVRSRRPGCLSGHRILPLSAHPGRRRALHAALGAAVAERRRPLASRGGPARPRRASRTTLHRGRGRRPPAGARAHGGEGPRGRDRHPHQRRL